MSVIVYQALMFIDQWQYVLFPHTHNRTVISCQLLPIKLIHKCSKSMTEKLFFFYCRLQFASFDELINNRLRLIGGANHREFLPRNPDPTSSHLSRVIFLSFTKIISTLSNRYCFPLFLIYFDIEPYVRYLLPAPPSEQVWHKAFFW